MIKHLSGDYETVEYEENGVSCSTTIPSMKNIRYTGTRRSRSSCRCASATGWRSGIGNM